MEEISSENKSAENSIYMTAALPDLVPQISQEMDMENSVFYETDDFLVQQNEDLSPVQEKIEENSPEEEKKTTDKNWMDVDLAETGHEIKLPIVCQEEYFEEIVKPQKSIEQNSVCVKNARLVQAGFMGTQSYYIYEISSVIQGEIFKVHRRYKDFEWLHETLKENYKGMSVPPIPPKTFYLFQDTSTTEFRRFQLEKCLQLLLKHSTLKKSKQLFVFLSVPESEFVKTKENMRVISITFKYNDIEDAIDQIISKIQAKMNQVFSLRIIPFSKDLVAIEKYLNLIRVPTYSISKAFAMTISSAQKTNYLVQNMHFFHSNKFYKTMQMHKHLVYNHDNALNEINSMLNEENLKIEALQGAIDDYKNVMKKYAELEALIERKIGKARRSVDDTEKYLADVENIKGEIKKLEIEICNIEGNIKNEKIWFQAQRDEYFEEILDNIFQVHLNRLEQEKNFWLEKKHE